ncbi:gustatory receptor 68a-like isoform X3 [Athalia rosae]|uniref:gustatory receptor 68a-like isoform X3 n=1 Tax=Athalia rosae TaxID=37344 RepID=UPI002033D9A1|nr:gustatory receptor 68a-like isoform X3 [Athalia rosae]
MYGTRRAVRKSNGCSNMHIVSLYYVAKISGLAPFSFRDDKVSRGSPSDKIYSLVFAALALPISVVVPALFPASAVTAVSEIAELTESFLWYLGFFGGVIPVATFASKEGIIVEIIKTLTKVQEIIHRSKMRNDDRHKSRVLAIQIGLAIFGFLCLNCGAAIAYWYSILDFWTLGVIVTTYLYCFTPHLVIIIFLNVLSFVENYLKELNNGLMNFCQPDRDLTLVRFRGDRIENFLEPRTGHETTEIEILLEIEFVYHKLLNVIEQIMELFSLPILLTVGYYFLNLLFCCFYIFTTYVNLSKLSATATYQVIGRIFWITLYFLELFAIARVCSSVQNTGKATAIILHKVWLKSHHNKMLDEIQMLSLQLLQRPLTISAFGFFSLDYSYLYKIFCAMVAYFVIMVQLDSSKSEPSALQHQPSTWNVTIPI